MKLVSLANFVLLLIHHGQSAMIATANLHADSTTDAIGSLLFYQNDATSPVRIVGVLYGLTNDTVHGFHIHRDPLLSDQLSCNASGPHFNPFQTSHGPREADLQNRHVGDLGNLTVNDNGVIVVELSDAIIDLYNKTRSIANRTVVLHAMRDDGGKGGFPDSNTTGNAGARIACGVISAAMEESNTKPSSSKASTWISDFIRKVFP